MVDERLQTGVDNTVAHEDLPLQCAAECGNLDVVELLLPTNVSCSRLKTCLISNKKEYGMS